MNKEEKKAKKEAKKNKQAKDRWFTWSGIRKEAKRVRWPHWKSNGSEAGIWQNSGESILFTAFFAVFFVLCDLLVTWLLSFVG